MKDTPSVLKQLHEIAQVISRPMGRSLREVFHTISAILLDLLEVDHSTVTLLDEGQRFFRIEAEYPQLQTQLVDERIRIQDRATQVALANRHETIVANNLIDHPLILESSSFRQVAEALNIQSMLIVPMVVDSKTVGSISLDTIGRTKQFSKEEVELCQTVANQLAALVEIVQLREEQEKYRRQAKLMSPAPTRTYVSDHEAKVARTLFNEAAQVIQFKKASLQLIIEGKRILVGVFGFEESRSNPWHHRPVDTDYLINEIVSGKRTKILANTTGAQGWEKQADTADVNSWIGVPLVVRGEVIGILTLDHDQPGFYADTSESVLAKLDELTALAAREVRDAHILEAAQHQLTALDIIHNFAEKVATKLDLDELLKAIAEAISQGLECTRCNVFVLEQADGSTSLMCRGTVCRGAMCDIITPHVLPSPRPNQLPSPVHFAFQSGETIFIEDREQDSRFDFTHEFYHDARSMIVVPLKIADRKVGVVAAVHKSPTWFSGADRLLLETLARQAASAIERDFGLQLVHSISNKMLGATELDTVLKEILSGALKLTHTDSGVIYVLNEDHTDVIKTLAAEGSYHPKPRLDNPTGITQTVISMKRMLVIRDIEEDTRVNSELRGRYRSMFAVPLVLDTSVVGVLYLNGKTVRTLTETEESLLYTLAGQAALAIQRARLYEQIKDSAAKYRSLFDNIPQLVCWKDTQSRFIWANASFCRSIGKTLDEIIGRQDSDFYPTEAAKSYVDDDKEVMLSKQPKVIDELNQPHPEQDPVWVRVVKMPVLDGAREVTGVQAIFWDLTEEKQMTERWRSLVEQSPDSIVIHKDGRIMISNPAAVRLFGAKSADDLKNRPILDFVDESSRLVAAHRLNRMLNKQDVAPMVEMRVRKISGEPVDVDVYTWPGPVKDEFQVVYHDVTRTKTLLREMHHRVRRSFNQVDHFLTLQEGFTNDPQVLHAFATLRQRIHAMALVHSILHQTRKESDVEMDLYLGKLKDALLSAHGTSEHVTVDSSAPSLILNEKQATACGLIVTELVSNSLLHAFPRGTSLNGEGQVSVTLHSEGGMVRLLVSDDGIGMSQLSGSEHDSMGLSLVRSLVVDDLKGAMKIDTRLRGGTTIVIDFKLTERRKDTENGR